MTRIRVRTTSSLLTLGFEANVALDNLDHDLATFLKKWFPEEVKAKQRYNEHMASIDQYGEVYSTAKYVIQC